MKRNIRKKAILLSAVILCGILIRQGSRDIRTVQTDELTGFGSQTVYGAELFVDGADSEQALQTEEPEPSAAPVPTDVPEPSAAPVPTDMPEPTITPQPTVTPEPTLEPTPTPGLSMNIENLNVYTQEGQSEDLFGDGTDLEDIPEDGADASFGGGYTGGGSMPAEPKEELVRQPRLLLESFNLSGKVLKAGDEADIELVFQNKSSSQGIYNLKVSLSTESSAVQFEKNSFYFSGVNPGAKITVSSRVGIAKNAEDGSIPMTVSFDYEDVKGEAATGTENVELRTAQPVSAVIDCKGIPSTVYSTDTIDLAVRVQNLSRTKIYNARVVLEGQGLFPKEEIFMGNMDAGTLEEGNMRIYVGTRTMKAVGQDEGTEESEMYGKTAGTLTLIYEDVQGKTYQDVMEYETQINKPEIRSLKIEAPQEANSWWYSVFVAAAAGMLLIIVGLAVKNRKQRILLEETRRAAADDKR